MDKWDNGVGNFAAGPLDEFTILFDYKKVLRGSKQGSIGPKFPKKGSNIIIKLTFMYILKTCLKTSVEEISKSTPGIFARHTHQINFFGTPDHMELSKLTELKVTTFQNCGGLLV